MSTCQACGTINRPTARFCVDCAKPLPQPPARPTIEDQRWLAATLNDHLSSSSSDPAAPLPTRVKEVVSMDETGAGDALIGGRYRLVRETSGSADLEDLQPWRRCWACGSTGNEAGELYCTDCGAALAPRIYRALVTPAATPRDVALIPQLNLDEATRVVLPGVWDQVPQQERTYTLLADASHTKVELPLDELTALRATLGLARLALTLHAQSVQLGTVTPSDLAVLPSGEPRLLATPGMERVTSQETAAAADTRALGTLLEALTATPRTTQRFDEQAAEEIPQDDIAALLRRLRTGEITSPATAIPLIEALIADRTQPVALQARVGACSHQGMVRDHNEDSMFFCELRSDNNDVPRSWGLYIVADGMGGHAAGELASGLAIRGAVEVVLGEYLAPSIAADTIFDEQALRDTVRRAILRANDYVINEGRSRGNDMGTTITMALVVGDRAVIGNVGDSRTYMLREGSLRRVSKDHSLVMRLVELGQISEDEIYSHPQRNAVLRSLGDKREIEVDLFSERLRPGDGLLLCSDGQWEMTRNPEMETIVAAEPDPQRACEQLIAAANRNGGEDNVTSILVRFAPLEQ